jgi:hypothetical protein
MRKICHKKGKRPIKKNQNMENPMLRELKVLFTLLDLEDINQRT